MTDHPNHVNVDAMPWEKLEQGERFASERKRMAVAAGGKQLGCSLFRIPPGKTAFPAHLHYGNEEALYLLSGKGTLRLGGDRLEVGAGDYVALPAGGDAHQLLNTGDQPLEYLCLSTMISPEVVEYPDSGKLGVYVAGDTVETSRRRLWKNFIKDNAVAYYEGE